MNMLARVDFLAQRQRGGLTEGWKRPWLVCWPAHISLFSSG